MLLAARLVAHQDDPVLPSGLFAEHGVDESLKRFGDAVLPGTGRRLRMLAHG
jgi:hypothetical protein